MDEWLGLLASGDAHLTRWNLGLRFRPTPFNEGEGWGPVAGGEKRVARAANQDQCPVPLSAMLCGDPLALSVMVMFAVSAPVTPGAKCPWMVQLAPTARLVPQVFANTNEDASAPVTLMLEMSIVSTPVLVRVTDLDELAVPTVCVP